MCDWDGEAADAWTSKWRQARKEHKCVACKETIRARDRYRYSSGVYDGNPFSYKHCVRCWRALELLQEITGEPPNVELDCGETYIGDNEELISLAFLSPDDGQKWMKENESRKSQDHSAG